MSYDIVGNKDGAVAIIEEGENIEKIAEEIIKKHKNVKTVLKKVSGRMGEFRLGEYEIILGEENTEVVHKEYGYLIKLDVQKVFFSPREAEERQRIAKQVKNGEVVLVMFSGVAPYAIAIAKAQPEVEKIFCIEKNIFAHKYAEENVRINKLSHKIHLILGDVKDEAERFFGKCDRVVMPMPFGASDFLEEAFNCLKKEGIIHFYSAGEREKVLERIKEVASKLNRKIEILNVRKVLQYAPRKWKFCVDFRVGVV